MKLDTFWDEKKYREIAKQSNNKQVVYDVKYARFAFFRTKPENRFHVIIDDCAFVCATKNMYGCRIIGMAVTQDMQNKGIGRLLWEVVSAWAYKNGCKKVYTRTSSGISFYTRHCGMQIVGQKGKDYLLEVNI